MSNQVDKLEALRQSIVAIEGDWTVQKVFKLLTGLIQSAESIYEGVGTGADKHAAVKAIWTELDQKYGIIDALDAMIKLPWWIEPFDSSILRLLIDFLITGIVEVLNATGVFKH